ncbi:hypothetical protein D8674_027568 [Pyrus ussuriensis x Pyrus communis]|uniref:Uncharacterized protein n=1 Tax=Pyrus ussuriensis x Pyrus communis TaxID=2448454 RepID=A0A5N5IQ42_9ROSA|nr:hypothetical protein D8674_027568 [Pyrus ussuriensis x Pyrus communis]
MKGSEKDQDKVIWDLRCGAPQGPQFLDSTPNLEPPLNSSSSSSSSSLSLTLSTLSRSSPPHAPPAPTTTTLSPLSASLPPPPPATPLPPKLGLPRCSTSKPNNRIKQTSRRR